MLANWIGYRKKTPMKKPLSLTVLLVAALGLAACGAEDNGSGGASSQNASAGKSEGAVTFTHPHPEMKGTTIKFDHQPQRIVMDCFSYSSLADYHIKPVALFGFDCDNPNVMGDIDTSSIEVIGKDAELNVERLAALRPDVIIGNGNAKGVTRLDADANEQMKRVAPFVGIPTGDSVQGDIDAMRKVAEFESA